MPAGRSPKARRIRCLRYNCSGISPTAVATQDAGRISSTPKTTGGEKGNTQSEKDSDKKGMATLTEAEAIEFETREADSPEGSRVKTSELLLLLRKDCKEASVSASSSRRTSGGAPEGLRTKIAARRTYPEVPSVPQERQAGAITPTPAADCQRLRCAPPGAVPASNTSLATRTPNTSLPTRTDCPSSAV